MLAEPTDSPVLVEVWPGGAAASRPGPAGAAGLSTAALDLRRPCCLAPQHHPSALPFLQVCPARVSVVLREVSGGSVEQLITIYP